MGSIISNVASGYPSKLVIIFTVRSSFAGSPLTWSIYSGQGGQYVRLLYHMELKSYIRKGDKSCKRNLKVKSKKSDFSKLKKIFA